MTGQLNLLNSYQQPVFFFLQAVCEARGISYFQGFFTIVVENQPAFIAQATRAMKTAPPTQIVTHPTNQSQCR